MHPIETTKFSGPAPYVPPFAIAYPDENAVPALVGADRPLPVKAVATSAVSTPLTGSASASGQAGPFVPELGRPIWLTLTGTWAGRVTVLRSLDGGATRQPLTVGGQSWASFIANVNEPVAEETAAATYYLSFELASGTVAYRMGQ